jgi:hypothetical protein
MDEVVGRVNDHDGLRILEENVRQREKHTRGRSPVAGLKQDAAPSSSSHLVGDVASVSTGRDDDSLLGGGQGIGAIDRVLEKRTGSGERTVLLRLMVPQPTFYEGPGSLAFATREHDGPEMAVYLCHERIPLVPLGFILFRACTVCATSRFEAILPVRHSQAREPQ